MKTPTRTLLAVFLLALPAASQDVQEAGPTLQDIVSKREAELKGLEGVVEVRAGGTPDEPRIMVRVESEDAKKAVRKKVGETLDGYKVFIYVAPSVGQTTVSPKPNPTPADNPNEKPKPSDSETPAIEDCDILRDHLKLKPVTRHRDGKTIPGCQLMRRTVIGGGGGHGFWYTRHRLPCPVRMGLVVTPKGADEFTRWVFTQGFQPAVTGSFLVYELKGSDSLWFDQVKKDLTSLLPYIREGARWVEADDKKAGLGWKWAAPK